jgi:hypothetical protein
MVKIMLQLKNIEDLLLDDFKKMSELVPALGELVHYLLMSKNDIPELADYVDRFDKL